MGADVTPLPVRGGVFDDVRGDDRWLRVSWHPAECVFVISIWRSGACVATFRLAREELPAFVNAFLTPLTDTDSAAASTG